MKYILTIDEGTTSVRAVLYDVKHNKIKKLARAYNGLIEPKQGWVEQDAEVIYQNTLKCLNDVTKHINLDDIYGLGITNQRETIVAWEKTSGRPLANAIIWKCTRTAKYCQKLVKSKIAKTIKDKTGLIVNSYFSATKIKWLLENNQQVKKAAKTNNICFGTIETYLVYRLTHGKVFVTDVTNASRTMLFNIKTLTWDKDLLKFFKIKRNWLAKIVANDEIVGSFNLNGKELMIAGLIGDQQSSLLGQLCINKGDVKTTYGTGCFMLGNVGNKPVLSTHNLLTTVACKINGKVSYALEGSIFSGGSIMNWMLEQKVAKNHRKLVKSAMKEKGNDIILVPAFNGLGAPYWNMTAKNKFVYFTEEITNQKIAKAGFDALLLRTYDIFKTIQIDLNESLSSLNVDGGQSMNRYLMQRQADILQVPIHVMNLESTCMGSIIASMLAFKIIDKPQDMQYILKPIRIYEPKADIKDIQAEINRWERVMKEYK